MGIYTAQVGGETVVRWWPGPTYQRPAFDPVGRPTITPVSPATDVREGATIALFPPAYPIPVTAYEFELERYEDGTGPTEDAPATADPLESTSFSQAFGDPEPTYAIASDTAGTELSLRCRARDRAGRWSAWIASDAATDIIAAALAPLFTVDPAVTGTTAVADTLTCDGGTVTGTPTPDIAYQWTRDGVDISGATAAAYVITAADLSHALACRVTATNTLGSASALSNATAVPLVFPSLIARSQFVTVETSDTTGINGTLDAKLGAAAGGSAISIDAAFTLHVGFSTTPGDIQATITAGNTVSGSGTVSSTTAYPNGTPVYATPFYRHTATGTRQAAFDQTDTVTAGGVTGPYGMIVVGGVTATNPIDALGAPVSSGYYSIATPITNHRATSITVMGDVYSANSMVALGVGCLKGDAASITAALAQFRYMLNTSSRNPHCTAGFAGNTDALFLVMVTCMKATPAVWAQISTMEKNRADAMMKVAALTALLVMSDNNPTGGNPINMRGYGGGVGNNQRSTVFNQAGMAQCYLQICLAWFGGVAGLQAVANTNISAISADIVATDLGANPRACGLTTDSNFWRTLNWGSVGYTGATTLGSAQSSRAPSAASVQTAVRNFTHFGHTLDEYHHLLAMATYLRDDDSQKRRPWIANGSYGTNYSDGSTKYQATYSGGNGPIVIGYGWGGNGLTAAGAPASSRGAATYVINGAATSATIPGFGFSGAPAELFAEWDEGKRMSMHYAVEGMRPLIGAWLCLWIMGLLDRNNADILTVLPVMNRAVRCLEYFNTVGVPTYAHAGPDGVWPVTQNWQRHAAGASPNGAAGGNLYATWTEVLAPALGL